MRFVFVTVLGFVGALLAGCGGSNSCNPLTTTGCSSGAASAAASVTVTSSAPTVSSDGTATATITALVKDANNNSLANAPINLAASAGTLSGAASTTGTAGTVTATLSGAGVAAGTTITVTGKSGSASGQTTVKVANALRTITLFTSAAQIPSDNSKAATITAVVKDANNNLLTGVAVSFQATSGAVAPVQTTAGAAASPVVPAGTTDANGEAQAQLTTPGDPSNRTITVTAAVGSTTATVTVSVTGTTLQLSAPASVVLGSSASGSVGVANASGQGIANTTVTLTSKNGNTISPASVTTNNSGQASFTLTGTKGGTDTITATALGLTQTASVSVSTQSFSFTAPASNSLITLGANQTVTVTWSNNGSPVSGQTVTFAATRGTLSASTATTNGNGQASVQISSSGAGPAIVQATAGSGANAVSAQLNVVFVASTPSQISAQPAPATVAVQGQSTITAQVRDANNNFVQGAVIDFVIVTDPTNGTLSVASATTDAQGRAQTVYTAGDTSSGANGVTISATVQGTSLTTNTTLTVGGQTVFLSLGTGNTIGVEPDGVTYDVVYSIFAVDSNGNPVPNVTVTAAVLPVAYGKGVLVCTTEWLPVYSTSTTDTYSYDGQKMCKNEDTDYTGNIASLGTNGTCTDLVTGQTITSYVKDYNCNGKLDPGNVAVVSPSSGTTDATGHMDVTVSYPKEYANWVEVSLIASTTVSGTQSSTTSTFVLAGLASDYASCTTGPPGPVSPYGTASTCADPR